MITVLYLTTQIRDSMMQYTSKESPYQINNSEHDHLNDMSNWETKFRRACQTITWHINHSLRVAM